MEQRKKVAFELRNLTILMKRYMGKHGDRHCGKHDEHDGHNHHHHGTTHVHMMAMGYIYQNQDRDIFQRDLEKALSVRRPTATNILKRMEKQGFITREPVPGDARLKKIVLTDKAKKHSQNMDSKTNDFEEKLTKGLTKQEIETFIKIIEKMKKNMEES